MYSAIKPSYIFCVIISALCHPRCKDSVEICQADDNSRRCIVPEEQTTINGMSMIGAGGSKLVCACTLFVLKTDHLQTFQNYYLFLIVDSICIAPPRKCYSLRPYDPVSHEMIRGIWGGGGGLLITLSFFRVFVS